MLKRSPLAVWRPLKTLPYQDAMPLSLCFVAAASVVFCGASVAGVALVAGTAWIAVEDDRESIASASTVRVEIPTTHAISTREDAPASSHIRSGDLQLMSINFRPMTICQFY
jgi:hypothetical protein